MDLSLSLSSSSVLLNHCHHYNSNRAISIVEQIISECSTQEAVYDPNQLMEESLPGSPMRSLNSLVQAVEWMIKQVENQTPISDPELSLLGSIGHIEEVLSDCIDQYNSAFVE